MTTLIYKNMIDTSEGQTFGEVGDAFYSNHGVPGANFSVIRNFGRLFVGDGADFEGATRGNNATLSAWVHTGDEGNNFFGGTPTQLSGAIDAVVTSINLDNVVGLPTSGYVKIEDEIVAYTGLSTNTLTGCTRGALNTTPAVHALAATVYKPLSPYGSRIQYAQTGAQAFFDSTSGTFAVTGAARGDSGEGIGVAGFGRLHSTAPTANVRGLYGEAVRGFGTIGQGSVWGLEIGVMNFSGDHTLKGGTPYNQGFGGQTLGLMVQAGGGNTNAYNADNPYVIAKGGASFWRGIVFEEDSIQHPTGGRAEAILLPEDYCLSWYGAGDSSQTLEIFSTIPSATYSQELYFNEFGMHWRKKGGSDMFSVNFVASAVNRLTVSPSATGNPVVLNAVGSDTNIDLSFVPKGTGKVMFGTYTGSVLPIAGYVEIKDASGTIRKLAVVA